MTIPLKCTAHAHRIAAAGLRRNNVSGYKGVSWAADKRRWRATITVQGETLYLGRFRNPEDAARAYDAAARHFHEGFAAVNFPREGERAARSSDTSTT